MRTPETIAFIKQHADLFWYIPDDQKPHVSDACLVETILNYGSMDAVLGLVRLMGVEPVARIFAESMDRSDRRRNNYHELVRHYFELVFRRYAPQCFNG